MRLRVTSEVDGEILGIFFQGAPPFVFEFVSGVPEMRAAAERWKRQGGLIDVIVNEQGFPDQQFTAIDSPEFMPRLAARLRDEFKFHVELLEGDAR